MNRAETATRQVADETLLDDNEQTGAQERETTDQQKQSTALTSDNALSKFDVPTLRGIGTSSMTDTGTTAFLPTNMAEAMEFAKMMCAGNFVPVHLRNKSGDCLAVIMQATRWGMDPFAVANKTYFVNNRMAFEAQLVSAVLNASKVLDGRLQVTWQGDGPTLACTVRGRIRGDADVHELIQELSTITTRNSPLWKQAPKVQLGYFTTRAWARLYAPEVLLGVYTPDEMADPAIAAGMLGSDPTVQTVIPPKPTRESVKAEKAANDAAIERMRKEQVANEGHARTIKSEAVPHDKTTGEVIEHENGPGNTGNGVATPAATGEDQENPAAPDNEAQTDQPPAAEKTESPHRKFADEFIGRVAKAGSLKTLNEFVDKWGERLNQINGEGDPIYAEIQAAIAQRKEQFAK